MIQEKPLELIDSSWLGGGTPIDSVLQETLPQKLIMHGLSLL